MCITEFQNGRAKAGRDWEGRLITKPALLCSPCTSSVIPTHTALKFDTKVHVFHIVFLQDFNVVEIILFVDTLGFLSAEFDILVI